MTCCICGNRYDPVNRNKNYFCVTDTEKIEVIPIHSMHIDGKTLALCPTCMKAAGFGKLIFSKNKRYVFNEPLCAKMFEIDQEWEEPTESEPHMPAFMKQKRKPRKRAS